MCEHRRVVHDLQHIHTVRRPISHERGVCEASVGYSERARCADRASGESIDRDSCHHRSFLCSVLSHPKQASHHPIDILPALDLLVFDLELCLIPAALEEEGEEVPNEPFPAANMPELAYELYRGEERSAEGAAK